MDDYKQIHTHKFYSLEECISWLYPFPTNYQSSLKKRKNKLNGLMSINEINT